MGVTFNITGQGFLYGGPAAISGYSVTEDATPISPADSRGGTGTFTMNGNEAARPDGTLLLQGNWAYLTDGSNGSTSGLVSDVDVSNGDVVLTMDSRLNLLVTDRQVLPFSGTLGDALLYYFDLAAIRDAIVIDPDIASRPVAYVGWKGPIWDNIKQICAAEQIEIALVSDNVVVRPLRKRTAVTYRDSSTGVKVSQSETARNVSIYLYNTTEHSDDTLVYPVGGWDDSVIGWWNEDTLTVNAGETQQTVLELSASLATISQPVHVRRVEKDYKATSVYGVVDQRGRALTTEEWADNGGFLSVEINPDTTSVTVTMRGANLEAARSPFRIVSNDLTAVLENDTDDYPVYSSLRLVGTGTFYSKELKTFSTSANPDTTATEMAPTIDNPFITDYDRLHTAVSYLMGTYTGANQVLTVTTFGINRIGITGDTDYMTFGEYDALQPAGSTFDSFDTQWAGQTFADFDLVYDTLVMEEYKNQAFGNVAGSRVRHGFSFYRINSASLTESSVTYTADADTLIGDFDDEWDDTATFEDFDLQWTTKSFNDFDRIPLWANGIGPTEQNTIFPSN